MSGLGEAELAIVMNEKMKRQQNKIEKLPDLIMTQMQLVFDRYIDHVPKPIHAAHGEEALINRIEKMVKTTIQSELRNHRRGVTQSAPDAADMKRRFQQSR